MDNILKNFCKKHNIILHKGENLHILALLVWNSVLLLKLKIHKRLHGIKKPIVHYYAVCWNEEKMLPFMFQYYGQFVDHFTIYDNYSDDDSEAIIKLHPNASIRKFQTDGFNDERNAKIKNHCWKHSRGKVDYVIVCDIDEFLYHKNISDFLLFAQKNKYSFFHPTGVEMFHPQFPEYDEHQLLTEIVTSGISNPNYGKCILFDPHRIIEINYKPGAHECYPVGIMKTYCQNDLKVLHYKNLGLDYIMSRVYAYRKRQSATNIKNEYAVHYNYENVKIADNFNDNLKNATPIIL